MHGRLIRGRNGKRCMAGAQKTRAERGEVGGTMSKRCIQDRIAFARSVGLNHDSGLEFVYSALAIFTLIVGLGMPDLLAQEATSAKDVVRDNKSVRANDGTHLDFVQSTADATRNE